MPQTLNSMDIFKLLNKSNCRECEAATCLAFSVLVFKGEKRLDDCPHLDNKVIGDLDLTDRQLVVSEPEPEEAVLLLRREIGRIDFRHAAPKLGGRLVGDALAIRCFGKDFLIDPDGTIRSACHINQWVEGALLSYVTTGGGVDAVGAWVPFGALRGGRDWNPLYAQMCENEMKKLADAHTELFFEVLSVFGGKRPADDFSADMASIIHPLPKIPILLCYWKPEDDFESKLNVLYDRTAEDNIAIESLYVLATGLANMFTRIIRTHG